MSRRTLPELFRSWAFKSRKLPRPSHDFKLLLEAIEERLAPATLPPATVLSPTADTASVALPRLDPPGTGRPVDYINPQVVADPTNPLDQVMVATSVKTGTTLGVVAQYTTDGGASWTAFSLPTSLRDPNLPSNTSPNADYTDASSPAVAFGRDGTVYFVYLVHNAAKTSGAVVFASAPFRSSPGGATVLYQWLNGDPARNPAIAVDNNLQSFTDPSGPTYTDTMANRTAGRQAVYVAWNGDAPTNPGDVSQPGNNYNPNPILAAVSGDDGATWSNPTPVSDGSYLPASNAKRGTSPQIAISPGNSGAPGTLVFVWPQQVPGQNYSNIAYETTRPDGGSSTVFTPQSYTVSTTLDNFTGRVPDAIKAVSPATFDTPQSQSFNLDVTAGDFTDPNFVLRDLSVDLAVVAPFLDQLSIVLTAPNGQSITLLKNHTRGDGSANPTPGGQPFAPGINSSLPGFTPASPPPPAAGLGVMNGAFSETVFSDYAARRISDPNSQFPFIGAYRPEGSFFTAAATQPLLLSSLFPAGATPADVIGTWTITITDFRNDGLTLNNNPYTAPEYLEKFGLTFSSVTPGMGTDKTIANTKAAPIQTDFNNAPLTGSSGVYPATSPTTGVPSTVSIAFDTSLGSFTPFGGSLYVAYTGVTLNGANPPQVTDTNIMMARGTLSGAGAVNFLSPVQVNDDSLADNFTEGDRPQFIPAVTVDAATGTVVATWYDTRLDANKTRAATFIATSIDGGASWSNQTITTSETADGTRPFLNQPKTALDVITGTTYTLQPVPTNVPQSSTFGLGIRQSVIAYGGKIYAYWAGNANAVGSSIMSAEAVTAAGPRVVGGDMGPVTTSTGSYNTQVAADGTRELDGITVTFDRPVDPATATNPANYTVRYNNPYNAVTTFTNIPVTSVLQISATQFLIRFAPQSAVGTYSYAVGPNIRDRVRTVVNGVTVSGNKMDQNANAITGQPNVDVFAVPDPVNGVPFQFPYVSTSLPLIIPGPHVVGTAVPNHAPGDATQVLAGVASAVDVTFDRDMNTNPAAGLVFGPSNIVRITGPAGVVYDRATAGTNPLTVTNTFGIASLSEAGNTVTVTTTGPVAFVAGDHVTVSGVGVAGYNGTFAITGVTATGFTYINPTSGLAPAAGGTVATTRTFRIGFPAQVLSGTYTIEIDPLFAAATALPGGTVLTRPALVDSNLNAGLDVLRGGSPTTGTPASTTYSASFSGAAATIPAAANGVNGVAEFPITVTDAYQIALSAGHQVQVQLNVSDTIADNTSVVDLIGELVAPDGTTVRLFTSAGNATRTPGTIWFSNTILVDTANTPIQSGFQPFDSGPYTPQFPLGALNGLASTGIWKIRIINTGTKTPKLTSWALVLPHVSSGTGLGEATADRFAVSFRVFNQNPTDPLTQDVWTAAGPASENAGGNTARTNALAVDPSDPSGNTVYLGAASGGVWKTNNFLTTDPNGPTWVPLTDSGPTYSLNVVSIAVFPRNNDPQQTIVFALTGEGDTTSPGVGVLRSMDGGRTWNVLDSTNNADTPTFGGNITPIAAASRDRAFFGVTGFKIVVDPVPVNDAEHDVIVYMASGSGVWRSNDTGRHWTRIRAGTATDIVLAQGSGATTGNLQILYAAFEGEGVFRAAPAYTTAGMVQLTGTPPGDGSFIDDDKTTQPRVPIAAPSDTPNGAKGRILLATPFLTNDPIEDLNYQGWLYALVVTAGNSLDGLYMTKDFGQNWTKVSLAEHLVLQNGAPVAGYGTNDYTQNDHDVFAAPPGSVNPLPGQGNYDVGFAIDPLNPNVVYIGGTNDAAIGPNGALIRVDTTGLQDAGAIVAYDNSAVDPNNSVQFTANTGNVTTKPANTFSQTTGAKLGPGQPYGVENAGTTTNTGLLNVLHDPNNPFSAASSVYFSNVAQINNTGWGARYAAFDAEVKTDIHRIITMIDPATGRTRVIVGDDQGVASAVDDGTGNVISQIGSGPQHLTMPSKVRNGNLQTIQFYSSPAQPGQLAAEIAGALFYGDAQDDGFPAAGSDILQTGSGPGNQIAWYGSTGDGAWSLTDQTGSGTHYDYQWPCCNQTDPNQFFQVNGVGRTLFLLQPGDDPTSGAGQWPKEGGFKFAVNPIDPNGIAISNGTGRVFRTVDQGRTWFQIAGPDPGGNTFTQFQNLGGYAPAIAYGAPDPASPNQLNNFLYAGTSGGKIWVTFTGGSQWTDISAGLSGSVQQIVPDPVRGTRDAYAVTSSGVFYKADAATAAPWVNITGNIFSLSKPIFSETNSSPQSGETAALRGLTSLAVDWRYAIPVNPADLSQGTFPVLYAGGYGGVFRSLDRGATWQIYPQGTTYTYTDPTTNRPATITTPDGGYFPSEEVTQLTLSQGNIDPATGQPLQQTGGLNLLTAATYGRGDWVIRLGTPDNDPAIAAVAKYQVVKQSGPQVIGVNVVSQPTAGGSGRIRVEFNAPVLASTFTTGQIQLKDAAGNPLAITGVLPIANNVAPAAYPAVPGSPSDYHNLFEVTFTTPANFAGGFGDIVIGPDIADYAGFGMNQDDDFTNGETTPDPNNGGAAADAYHGSLFLSSTAATGNLHINMPTSTTAGAPTRVIVSDLDPNTGLPVTGYTGTISLTATINGRQAVLTNAPVYGITSLSESGTTVTVTTVGTVPFAGGQQVTVGGVGTAGYNGTFTVISVTPTGFTYFDPTTGLAPDTAGGGNVTGPLTPVAALSGTPTPVPGGPLPTTYTFTDTDAGTHVFTIFYLAASDPATGQTLLSVADTSGSPVAPNPAQAYITVTPGTATQFVVTGLPDPDVAGTVSDLKVAATDPYGNIDPTYTGTVTLTTTDPIGTIRAATYTFTSGVGSGFDNGVHVFPGAVQLKRAGTQTVTATDATKAPLLTLTGAQTVLVVPATPSVIDVTGFPNPVTAGTSGDVTLTLSDPYGNLATNYTGMVSFTSTDPQAVLPADYTFTAADAGSHTFTNGVTLKTAGTRAITATDAAIPLSGSESGIVVTPAATSQLVMAGYPVLTVAGVAHTFTVTAEDQYGNTTPAYRGTVTVTSTDGQAVFTPTPFAYAAADNGVKAFTGTFETAGVQSITVNDAAAGLTGTQTGIQVVPPTALTNQNLLIAPGTGLSVPETTELTGTIGFANLDHWTLTFTAGTTTVRTFTGTGTAVDVVWDGTDTGGAIVPDGVYTATLTVYDQAGNSVSLATQTVAVLTHPPAVTIRSNGPTTYGQSITLTATASLPAGFPASITDLLVGVPVHFFNGSKELAAGTPHPLANVGGLYQVSVTVPSFNATTAANPNLVTARKAATSTFLAGTSAAVQVVVNPAPLAVSAVSQTVVYGTVPTFTYTFNPAQLVNGDTAAVFSGSPAVTPAQPVPIPAGSYTIGRGTLTAGPNYAVTFTPGTLTVNKAPLTVTVDDAVRAEGAANPAFTARYQGLVAGDSPAVVGLNLTTTATAASTPGRYPITATPAPNPANYAVTVVPGVLTVIPGLTDIALGSGGSGQANVYTPGGQFRSTASPFGPGFAGGVRTVTGDFNHDGVSDLAVGSGPGVRAEVVVLDGATGGVLFDEFPFEGFTGGVFVAAGDITKDGTPELVVTPDQGGGPRVRVYRGGDFAPILSFLGINDPDFRGGARAGVGDLNGDGYADIAVSAGFQGGPRVSIWDGRALAATSLQNLTPDFFAFDPSLRNGVYVAIGDVNNDGFGDLIAGAGPGGGPAVKVFDGRTLLSNGPSGAAILASFFAGDSNTRQGVRVAAKNLDGDAFADIVTGDAQSGVATAFAGKSIANGTFDPLFAINDFRGVNGGVYVG